ncbi:MAG: multifunctional 2',3'-cyclic-nucleotide 2'-phosphodiesterase/5'-nucleotidase/3'-nucleotidase [Desulfitibacter sp. BRH_c19]|nr:MAG: multifunctional 2',3'-cyclic-nucleotide 2'-phosphodiesterase/5'-nucleotidase/3'-nucleotidase [Desulfitibacter sp. BRH_c19]
MKRSRFNRFTLTAVLVLTLIFLSFGGLPIFAEEVNDVSITIIHTNDLHGRVVEGAYDGMGFGKIATLVDQLMEENPNSILLDAGDAVHGLPFATMVEGESIISIMNTIGYDAMVPGNHDFNYGQERLLELDEMATFPILAANVMKEDGTNLLQPYIVKEMAGLRIAIFGLATPETLFKSHPKGVVGLDFIDPVESAKKMVDELKDESDIIIALAHLGMDEESIHTSLKVAEVEGIDILVDGHSHTVLTEGMLHGDTLIVSSGEYGKFLGIVDISIKEGVIVDKKARLITKDDVAELEEKSEITDLISEISEAQELVLSEIIGRTAVDLDGEREMVRKGETNLGNLLTDVFLDVTGADVALTNGGGIRGSIPAGDISRDSIISVFPFGNSIETKQVKGADLKAMLEHGTDVYPELKGAFPHVAGMTFKIDVSKTAGDRVVDIMVSGAPLELDKEYILATNDFLAAGGDDYSWLIDAPSVRQYMAMDEALIAYIEKHEVIEPKVEGRITEVEPAAVEEVEELDEVEEAVEEVIEEAIEEEEEAAAIVELEKEMNTTIYIVKEGDWLSTIAAKFGTTWQKLQEVNQLKNPHLIFPYQEIVIPVE